MNIPNKSGTNFFVVILIILLLCVIGVLSYIVITDNNPSNDKTNNNDTNDTAETLYVKSDLVQQLYSMVDISNNTITTGSKYFGYYYQKDSYTVNSMDNVVKLALGIKQVSKALPTPDVTGKPVTINASDVSTGIKRVFGPSITYQNANLVTSSDQSDRISCLMLDYNSTSNTYNGTIDTCNGTVFNNYISSELISAIKTDKKIEITEKMAYFVGNENEDFSGGYFDVYSDLNKTKKITGNIDVDLIIADREDIENSIFSNYAPSLKSYKYIFNLGSDGNYYFSSVELVK